MTLITNMSCQSLSVVAAVVAMMLLLTASPANAASALDDQSADVQAMTADLLALEDGESLVLEGDFGSSTITRDLEAFAVEFQANHSSTWTADSTQAAGPCNWAVTSAVYALGAIAIGALAAATAAAGGAVIAGYFFSTTALQNLAIIAGSWSAVSNFVALYAC